MEHLNPGGIVCGTTDFYFPTDTIIDSAGYMKGTHYIYWSYNSLALVLKDHGHELELFELIRPGSILPDEKFKKLWPNKRVFFMFDPKYHGDFFSKLKELIPILPIDRP